MPVQESFQYLKKLLSIRTKARHQCSTCPCLHAGEHYSALFSLKSCFENNKEIFLNALETPTSHLSFLQAKMHEELQLSAELVTAPSACVQQGWGLIHPWRHNTLCNYTPQDVLRQHKPPTEAKSKRCQKKKTQKNVQQIPQHHEEDSVLTHSTELQARGKQKPPCAPGVADGGGDAHLPWAESFSWISSPSPQASEIGT